MTIPREHGAWGMLLVPLVSGAVVASTVRINGSALTLFIVAALALFWLRTPVESLLGTSAIRAQTKDERCAVAIVIAGLAVATGLGLGALLWAGRNPALWLIGAAAVAAFAGQALLKKLGRRTRMLSEMVGTIGLAASGPAAYYVITGKFGATAWIIWIANLIFAGGQIHYVQLRIHTARVEGLRAKLARGWNFALGQLVMAVALAVACTRGLMPWGALAAFVPILFRGWFYFVQKPAPLIVRKLGWNELYQAVVFCALFISAFALAK